MTQDNTQDDIRDYRQDHRILDSDPLETTTPSPSAPGSGLSRNEAGGTTDSPTSESDAGLSDALIEENSGLMAGSTRHLAEMEDTDQEMVDHLEDDDLDENLPPSDPTREMTITDLAASAGADLSDVSGNSVMTYELSDMSAPGQVDIEELPDDALSGTDIPADALLDPIEE